MVTISKDSEITELLTQHDRVIIKFYADWCGNCKLFSPKYRRLSEDSRFEGITFLDINAEENENTRKLAGVNNLPYFAIFKNGKLVEGAAASLEDKVVDLLNLLN